MSLRDIRVLYVYELRSALRDRTIVINSILMPIFLYPVLLWFMLTGVTFVMGRSESMVSRVEVRNLPAAHGRLERKLRNDEKIEIAEAGRRVADPVEAVRAGRLDAFVEFGPPSASDSPFRGDFSARITYDGSQDRSAEARARVAGIIRDYRSDWLKNEVERLGVTETAWRQFDVERKNVATRKQMGARVMGLMLPLFLVIMVAVGCFHPAVDSTAGERERGTWETLMTVAASRPSIVTAKYLYVATMGAVAGLLNLTAMVLSIRAVFAPLLADAGEVIEFKFPLQAVPVMAFGSVLLALFVAAGMMILASFARTFREGQSMVSPFYMLIILPVIFLQDDSIEFTPLMASIPVANLMMVFREAISARFDWPLIGLTMVVEIVLILLCLRLAAFILKFEDVLIGSYSGSLIKFLRERGRRARPPAAAGGEAT